MWAVGVPQDVQNVVPNLEGHAHGFAETPHRGHPVARGAHGQRPGRRADAQKARGFLIDDVKIGLAGHRAVGGALVLQNLALAQRSHRPADMRNEVELPALQAYVHVFGKDVITQDHGFVRLPAGVGRRLAAAHVGLVDHVVVDQRRDVDHFDQHGGQTGPAARGSPFYRGVHRRRKHDEHGTDAFAARRKGVTQHIGEQLPLGRELAVYEFVEGLQFRSHGFADVIECNHIRKDSHFSQ